MKNQNLSSLLNDVLLYPEMRKNLLKRYVDYGWSRYRSLVELLYDHDHEFTVDILTKFAPFDKEEIFTLEELSKQPGVTDIMVKDMNDNVYKFAGNFGATYLVKRLGESTLIEMSGSTVVRKLF